MSSPYLSGAYAPSIIMNQQLINYESTLFAMTSANLKVWMPLLGGEHVFKFRSFSYLPCLISDVDTPDRCLARCSALTQDLAANNLAVNKSAGR